MDSIFDLCIIGAGMVGSAAARYASENSEFKTCLIGPPEIPYEKWNETQRDIFASHYDEGRITRAFDDNDYLRLFGVQSIARYRELETLSGISFYHDVGCLYMGTTNDNFIKTLEDGMKNELFKFLNLSDTQAFKAKFPFLRKLEDEVAYLDTEGAGHISPRGMVQAQQTIAIKQGCQLIPEVVNSIDEFQNNELLKVTLENGQKILTRKALVCTNAFTNFRHLLSKEVDVTIYPETVALLQVDESEAHILRTMPSMIYRRHTDEEVKLSYILPPIKYPNGKWYTKIGLSGEDSQPLNSSEEVKDWYLSRGDIHIMNNLSSILQELLPDITPEAVERCSCVTCFSPTELPYIDHATDKIVVAIALNGVGAKWSDEAGRIAAGLATTGQWDSEAPQSAFKIRWKE